MVLAAKELQSNLQNPAFLTEDPMAMYIMHTQCGVPLRELARKTGMHPSTIMRRVRRIEDQRDDPLLDRYLEGDTDDPQKKLLERFDAHMKQNVKKHAEKTDAKNQEDMRLLKRLCERGVFFAIADGGAQGAIFRKTESGEAVKLSDMDAKQAQQFRGRDWISCTKPGKVNVYHVTDQGRAALRRHLLGDIKEDTGFAEQQSPFARQHREFGQRVVSQDEDGRQNKVRVNLRESPVTMLACKNDRDGQPFLDTNLVKTAERLREDFELSQMGPRVTQNWDHFLTGGRIEGSSNGVGGGSDAARRRLQEALAALGTGLGDIALRCCCFLEGLEVAEKRMGWSARSGKIVLRIALQKLNQHYQEQYGGLSQKIG